MEDTQTLSSTATTSDEPAMTGMVERYEAAMVLSGVGDAMGYKDGNWEFCRSGLEIHADLAELGGVENLDIRPEDWIISDDTVMHLATAEALVETPVGEEDKEKLYLRLARNYQDCMEDMAGRAVGATCCGSALYKLKPDIPGGYHIPFNKGGGGCGAAMRAMCIGLRYPTAGHIDHLIEVSIESGRMTHHHPTGYLGAMTTALFTSYAIQHKPLIEWGVGLIAAVDKAFDYIQKRGDHVEDNVKAWDYFKTKWIDYLKERHLESGKTEAMFPAKYGIEERDAFYRSVAFRCLGGASGHDAPMIAYDALLSSEVASRGKESQLNPEVHWRELCHRGMLHGGDNDSTGVIAGACYGAMFGFEGVPEKNHSHLEYRQRLKDAGKRLYEMSHPQN